jgi:choice-of-anchor B domain-containing protein
MLYRVVPVLLALLPGVAHAQSSGGVPLVPLTGQRAVCTGGFARPTMGTQQVAFPCKDIDLMSFLPISAVGGVTDRGASSTATIATTWGWTDPQTRREYALLGRSDGTAFVDVTNPLMPVYVGFLPRPATRTDTGNPVAATLWHEFKTTGNTLVIVSEAEGHGLQTFDLTALRQFSGTPITFAQTGRYSGFGRAHNVLVSNSTPGGQASGLAIASGLAGPNSTLQPGCGLGLHFVDVSDPAAPVWAGCYNAPGYNGSRGYTHDAQCVAYRGPDTRYTGRTICLLSNEKALILVDATDRDANGRVAARDLSFVTYPGASTGYTHQGWLSEDHRYFYLDDEFDEGNGTANRSRTLIFDVQDLTRPIYVNAFLGRTTATDHNQYVRGQYDFQANYRAGVAVLDISNPPNPVEAAYFDTYPASDASGYEGIWNVYPYFSSGTLIAGGIREGLFVLKPTSLALNTTPVPPVEGFGLTLDGANPARTPVRVRLALDAPAAVRVAAYDVLGREVALLFEGQAAAGFTPLTFDATGLAAGVYIVNARTASASLSRRLVVVR